MNPYFPFDLLDAQWLAVHGGEMGQRIASLAPLSLHPPFPWGQWLYGRLLAERGPHLRGDIVECGVAKGGMSIFLGTFARQLGRKVYACDSFAGLPPPDPAHDNAYFRAGDYAAGAGLGDLLGRFQAAVREAGLAETIVPIPGFFATSLGLLPVRQAYAFVHIDVDLYQSTLEVLERLFPSIVEGGLLVIDDFFHHSQGPARAASAYFSSIGYSPLYHISFPYSVVVVKGEAPPPSLHRAIDGNRYSLDFLRRDQAFLRALSGSCERAEAAGARQAAENARRLRDLLVPGRPDASADIYEYWGSLTDFWDAADAPPPDRRVPIAI
jgi:O-methyltransferase